MKHGPAADLTGLAGCKGDGSASSGTMFLETLYAIDAMANVENPEE